MLKLLTTVNNVGSKTLFNAVFINPQQVVHFFAVLLPFCQFVPKFFIVLVLCSHVFTLFPRSLRGQARVYIILCTI